MAKKIELLNDQQEVVHPLTSPDCIIMENGKTLDEVMGDGVATPTLTHEGTSFKVGVGDSNIEVVDGDVAGMTLKGQSYQNILPKPTTLIMETDEQEFKINDKIDSNIIIDDNIAEIATVKGKTIVNTVQEESGSEYTVLGEDLSGQSIVHVKETPTLEGQTLVNLANQSDLKITDGKLTKDKGVYTVTVNSNFNATTTYVMVYSNNVHQFKPNTKYLVKANVIENNFTTTFNTCVGHGTNIFDFNETDKTPMRYQPGETGVKIGIYTTKSDFTGVTNAFRCAAGTSANPCVANQTIKFQFIFVEYQEGMENLDIPYFEGTKYFESNIKGVTLQGQTLVNAIQEPSEAEYIVVGEELSGKSVVLNQGIMNLEGDTLTNILPKPSLRGSMENTSTQKLNTRDDVVDVDGELRGATLKGKTLVNLAKKRDNNYQTNIVANTNAWSVYSPLTCNLVAGKKYFIAVNVLTNTMTTGAQTIYTNNGFNQDNQYGLLELSQRIGYQCNSFVATHNTSNVLNVGIERHTTDGVLEIDNNLILCEYEEGMENWYIPYFEGMASVSSSPKTFHVLPEPSLRGSMENKAMQRLNEGHDEVVVKNGEFKSAILTGNTLVNLSNNLTSSTTTLNYWYNSALILEDISKLKRDTYYTVLYKLEDVSGNHDKYTNGEVGFGTTGYAEDVPKANTTTDITKNGDWCKIRFKIPSDFQSNYGVNANLYIRPIRTHTTPTEDDLIIYTINGFVLLEGDYISNPIPFNEVFGGMQSVKMPVLTTTGKNLVDGIGDYIGLVGDNGATSPNIIAGDGTLKRYSYIVRCKPNTTYTLTTAGSANRCSLGEFSEYPKVGINGTKWGNLPTSGTLTITTKPTTNYLVCYSYYSETVLSQSEMDEIIRGLVVQLEESSTATTYEPHKSNILTTSEEIVLRGIDDVKDELNLLTGELTQRIGEIVLDETLNKNKIRPSNLGANGYVLFSILQDDIKANARATVKSDKLPTHIGTSSECIYGETNGETVFWVCLKESSVGGKTADIIYNYLCTNPITVQYILETPITRTVNVSCDACQYDKTLVMFQDFESDIHVSTSSHALQPQLELDYNSGTISGTNGIIDGEVEDIKSASLKGQTLVNIQSPALYYLLTSCPNGTFTDRIETEREISFTVSLSPSGNWYYMGLGQLNLTFIKPSTKYLVLFEICEGINSVAFVNANSTNQIAHNTPVKNNVHGIPYSILTTLDEYVESTQQLYLIPKVDIGTKVHVKNAMIIEYQEGMENWDIPYFEGMTSIKMPVLSTVGKNLLDKSKLVDEHSSHNYLWTKDYIIKPEPTIKLKSNTTYTLSLSEFYGDGDVILWNGEIKTRNVPISEKNKKVSFTTTSEEDGISFYAAVSESEDTGSSKIQLEEGSTATTYELYKSNILTCNEEVTLRAIGDVKDELDLLTGRLTQRIGEVVLDGSENWVKHQNTNETTFYAISDLLSIPQCKDAASIYGVSDKMVYGGAWEIENVVERVNLNTETKAYIRVNKDRIGGDSLDGFKQWLSQNPITVQYVLATPITRTVDLSAINQDNVTLLDKPRSYKDGHIQALHQEGSLLPSVSYEIPTTNSHHIDMATVGEKYTVKGDNTNELITYSEPYINDDTNLMVIKGDYVDLDITGSVGRHSELVNVVKDYDITKTGKTFVVQDANARSLLITEPNETAQLFKSNTKYLIQFEVNDLVLDGINNITLRFINSSTGNDNLFGSDSNYKVSGNGVHRCIRTTTDLINTSRALIKGDPREWEESTSTSRKMTVSNIMFIEYQHGMENWDLPYFEGTYETYTHVKPIVKTVGNYDSTYEPHKSSNVAINEEIELRAIGDVRDELNVITGELTQRIGETVLNGNETWYLLGVTNGFGRFTSTHTNSKDNEVILCDKMRAKNLPGDGWTNPQEEFIFKGTSLAIVSKLTTVTELKEYLSQNPITVQYQLTAPIIKKVDLTVTNQDNTTINKPLSYKDGHIQTQCEGNSLLPDVNYEIPTSNSYHIDTFKQGVTYTAQSDTSNTTVTLTSADTNPYINGESNLMLIEGDYTSVDVPYFEGVKHFEYSTPRHINGATIEGQTHISLVASMANTMKNTYMQKLNDGHDDVNVVDGEFKSAILKGNTLVNLATVSNNGKITPKYGNVVAVESSRMKTSTEYTWIIYNDATEDVSLYVQHWFDYRTFVVPKQSFIKVKYLSKTTAPDKEKPSCLSVHIDMTVEQNIRAILLEGDYTNVDIPYFTGMTSVKMPVLTTTGKNLVNQLLPLNSNGDNLTTTIIKNHTKVLSSLIKILPNQQVVISKSNYGNRFRCFFYDSYPVVGETMSIGGVYSDTTKQIEVTSPPNAQYLFVVWCDDKDVDYPINYQVEYGKNASSYEPHKSNILTCNEEVELRGIGDVKDELNLLTGELTQRVDEVNVKDAPQIGTSVGNDTIRFGFKYSFAASNQIISNYPVKQNIEWQEENIGVENGINDVNIRIPKSELADESYASALKFIEDNNIKIYGIMKEPTTKTIDLTVTDQDNVVLETGKPLSYKDGHIQVSSQEGSLLPSVDYEIPTLNSVRADNLKPNTTYTFKNNGKDFAPTFNVNGTDHEANNTFTSLETNNGLLMITSQLNDTDRVSLVEGNLVGTEVSYFEGMKSVKNPIVKVTGKNLFNLHNEITNADMTTHSITNNALTVTGVWYVIQRLNLKPNTQYTLSYEKADSISGYKFVAVYCDNITKPLQGSTDNKFTFTTPTQFDDVAILFYAESGNMNNTVTYYNIQIEESSTATSYEPHKSTTVSSKNIFDGVLARDYLADATGLPAGYTHYGFYTLNYMCVAANEEYCISASSTTQTGIMKVYYYDKNYNYLYKLTSPELNTGTTNSSAKAKFTVPNDSSVAFMRIRFFQGAGTITANIRQVITLRAIGDVKDELDLSTGTLTQRIGEVVLDGSNDEKWSKTKGDIHYYFCPNTMQNATTRDYKMISNYATGGDVTISKYKIQTGSTNPTTICISLDGSDLSLADFRTTLQNNPLIVQYKLVTPIIHQIDLQTLDQDGNEVPTLKLQLPKNIITTSSDLLAPNINIPANINYDTIIKPSTQYTLRFNQDVNADNPLTVNLGGAEQVVTSNHFTMTTPATLAHNQLQFSGKGNVVSEVQVIEGDVTGIQYPFFEGMNDVKFSDSKFVGRGKNIWQWGDLLDIGVAQQHGLGLKGTYYFSLQSSNTYDEKPIVAFFDIDNALIAFGCATEVTRYDLTREASHLYVYSNGFSYSDSINSKTNFTNIMLTTEPHEAYQPYCEPVVVQQDVDSIPLTSDMFEQNGWKYNKMINGMSMQQFPTFDSKNRIRSKSMIKVKPNTTYTLNSVDNFNDGSDGGWIVEFDKNGTYIGERIEDITTFTTRHNTEYIAFVLLYLESSNRAISPSDLDSMNLILQEVPQEIVLRGIGNVKDELDLTRGEYIQRIKEFVLNGSEDWVECTTQNGENTMLFQYREIGCSTTRNDTTDGFMCSQLKNATASQQWTNDEQCISLNVTNAIGIRISKTNATNKNELLSWLQKEPITIQCRLNVPIIHKVNLTNTKVIQSYATETHYETITPSDSLIPNITIPSTLNYDVAIKPSTEYTIRANTSDNLTVDLGGATGTLSNGKVTLTTPATLAHNEVKFSGTGKVKELMVVEGNEIKDNVPFFNGMKDVEMGGIKLVNLIRNISTYNSFVSINENKTTITYTDTGYYGNVNFDSSLLKPNTLYTLYFKITQNTSTLNMPCGINIDGNAINPMVGNGGIGTFKIAFTSSDKLVQETRFVFRHSTNDSVIKVQDLMLFEGDWTHLDEIPYIESEMIIEQPIIRSQGKNLFDVQQFYLRAKNINGVSLDGQTLVFDSRNNVGIASMARNVFDNTVFKPNTQYTITFTQQEDDAEPVFGLGFSFLHTDGTTVSHSLSILGTQTITSAQGKTVKALQLTWSTQTQKRIAKLSNIQLEEGSTATSYEPYKHQTLYSNRVIGYEEGCWYAAGDGVKQINQNLTSLIADVEGLQYAYVHNTSSHYTFWDKDGVFISGLATLPTALGLTDKNGFLPIPSNAKYMKCACGLYEYGTATVTGELPLRSLPNGVCDTLNLVTGEYVQRVGEIVLDKDYMWKAYETTNSNLYSYFAISGSNLTHSGIPMGVAGVGQSDKLIFTLQSLSSVASNYYSFGTQTNDGGFAIIVRLTGYETSLEEFKKYLSQNPITVQYQLATPIVRKLGFTTKGNYAGLTLGGGEDLHVDGNINNENVARFEVKVLRTGKTVYYNPNLSTVWFGDLQGGVANTLTSGQVSAWGGDSVMFAFSKHTHKVTNLQEFKQWLALNSSVLGFLTKDQTSTSYSDIHAPIFFNNVDVKFLENNFDIQPQLTFQARTRNSYVMDMMKPNVTYTMKVSSYDANTRICMANTSANTSVMSNKTFQFADITLNDSQKQLVIVGNWYEPMIIEGDLTGKNLPYFKGILSSYHDVDEIEIYSVNKNLFDKSFVLGNIDANGNHVQSTVNILSGIIEVKGNTAYSVSGINKHITNKQAYFIQYDQSMKLIKTGVTFPFITDSNCKYLRLQINQTTDIENINNSLQLEEGSVATSYIPHAHNTTLIEIPTRLETVKVVRPVLEKGQLDRSNGQIYNDDQAFVRTKEYIPVTQGEVINIQNANSYRAMNIIVYDINKSFVQYIYTDGNGDVVIPKNGAFVRGYCGVSATSDLTITRMAYKPIQLNSLPNGVYDEIIMKPNSNKAQLVQRVGKVVLDGSGDFHLSNDKHNITSFMQINALNLPLAKGTIGLIPDGAYCDKLLIGNPFFKEEQGIPSDKSCVGVYIDFVRLCLHELDENEHVYRNYLQQNPITIYYELDTPIIHEIQLKGYPHVYENGTVTLNTDIPHQTFVSYNVNQEQLINTQNETIIRHDQQIDDLYYYIELYLEEIYQMELFRMRMELSL